MSKSVVIHGRSSPSGRKRGGWDGRIDDRSAEKNHWRAQPDEFFSIGLGNFQSNLAFMFHNSKAEWKRSAEGTEEIEVRLRKKWGRIVHFNFYMCVCVIMVQGYGTSAMERMTKGRTGWSGRPTLCTHESLNRCRNTTLTGPGGQLTIVFIPVSPLPRRESLLIVSIQWTINN